MQKFYNDNYNSEQLEKIIKMNKLLNEVYNELFGKRKRNILNIKKRKKNYKLKKQKNYLINLKICIIYKIIIKFD